MGLTKAWRVGESGQFQQTVREESPEFDDYLYYIRESGSGDSNTDSWVNDGTYLRDREQEKEQVWKEANKFSYREVILKCL